MKEFAPMAHGTHGWDEQYNNDMGLLFGEMADAKANSIMNLYTHSKTGTTHALTGEGAVMRFYATAPWAAGDTIAVNGEAVNPITLDGAALPAGGFVSGMWVVAVKDGKNLQFLTQSYAGVFADINSQLANKVNKAGELIPLGADVLSLAPGRYYVDGMSAEYMEAMNLPLLTWHYEIVVYASKNYPGLIQNYKTIFVYPSSTSKTYMNKMGYDGKWSGWTQLVTAEPPQEFDLPLADGHLGGISYFKTQEGIVTLNGCVHKSSGNYQNDDTIAVLPVGYRPKIEKTIPSVYYPTFNAGHISISTDGKIYVRTDSDGSTAVYFGVSYAAML